MYGDPDATYAMNNLAQELAQFRIAMQYSTELGTALQAFAAATASPDFIQALNSHSEALMADAMTRLKFAEALQADARSRDAHATAMRDDAASRDRHADALLAHGQALRNHERALDTHKAGMARHEDALRISVPRH